MSRDKRTDGNYGDSGGQEYDNGYDFSSDDYYDDSGDYDDYHDYDDYEPEPEEYRKASAGRRKGGNSRRRRGNGAIYIIIVVLAVVLVICIYQVGSQLLEYWRAAQEYDQLSSLFEVIPETEEEQDSEDETQELPYPQISIDFDALKEINDEFVCVLHIPALDLTYPVAQTTDNSKYLTTTFEGSTNSSGCIYLDAYCSADFLDWNTFIYGHNMKNQTMFGSLKLFLQDNELCNEDPYIYIYQEEQVLIYRIFAFYTIPVDDDVYNNFYDEDGYDVYVADVFAHSQYADYEDDGEIDWTQRPNLLTLSTCYGTDHTYNFIVQGALVETVFTS